MASIQDLDYQAHFKFFEWAGYITGNAERDAYWHFSAQEQHSLAVLNGLLVIQGEIVVAAQNISQDNARHQILHGAAKRSRFIWDAFRQLHHLIPPDRSEPMLIDHAIEAGRALNDIYIHTRGILDNYAWALLYLFSPAASTIRPAQVNLFGKSILGDASLSDFKLIIEPFEAWHNEVKERRDPVAHRIPLSVPPSMLSPDDTVRYRSFEEEYSSALRELAAEVESSPDIANIDQIQKRMESIRVKQQKLGRFAPIIVHDPEQGGTRIYPTVPEDLGKLTILIKSLNTAIDRKLTPKT